MTTDPIQAAWHARAEALADWALPLFFARRDRYGGYYVLDGKVEKCAKPKDRTPNAVHRGRILAHFRATRPDHIVGAFSLAPEPHCVARAVAADIDAHGDDADPERNRAYAEHLYYNLAADSFRPLLATWGGGSFHLHALFDRDVAGDALFRFGRWLVADAPERLGHAVESFPKQSSVGEREYGNWLRLVGRHPKRDVWASVFDGTAWLTGELAVAHLLTLTGDSPDLIPGAARTFDPSAAPPVPAAERRRSAVPAAPDDVFGEFNAAQTMHSVAALLQRNGWAPAGRRGERWDFRRPGKGDDKSGNLMLVAGVPLFYGFTTNGGITSEKGLTPTRLRAELEFAGDFARLAAALRAEGYGPPIPVRELPAAAPVSDTRAPADPPPSREGLTPPAPPAAAAAAERDPDEPQLTVAIIREHFRSTYRPRFRRGGAIHCPGGELVNQADALAAPTSKLIAALARAVDAPRDRQGNVLHEQLPAKFARWAKIAWGDLLAELPDEDGAKLGKDDVAAEQFRGLIRDALLTLHTLGKEVSAGRLEVIQTEKRSVIDWCWKFAKPGGWKRVRSLKCWCRSRAFGGQVVLQVAIRQELFGQLAADKYLRGLTFRKFADRCEEYGVGASTRDERPDGGSAVVLSEPFVAELLGGAPDPAADNTDDFWSDPEEPKSKAG